jgi:hypothetical protein
MSNPQNGLYFTQYYAGLLILQYLNKVKATATIQAMVAPVVMPQTTTENIAFATIPSSGTFVLNYNSLTTAAINWNDSAATIQGKLQALTGLGSVTVTGSIASGVLTVTFTSVPPPAAMLSVDSNTTGVVITVTATDVILPLALQNAFNLTGSSTASGVQLNTLGKYAGVTRTGTGFNGVTITLSDADFLSLIQVAILRNSSGSSLSTIQALLAQFFPGEIYVFDYQNMQMSYLINSSIGSFNLAQLLVTENLLPKPMGVSLALTIYSPSINLFFGFRTYILPAYNNTPFNSYASYNSTWVWLSYQNAV